MNREHATGVQRLMLNVAVTAWFCANQASAELWEKTFGGAAEERGNSVQQTADGGFIIAGFTESFGLGSSPYLIRLGRDGHEIFSRVLGGPLAAGIAYSVKETPDGGFIVAGGSSDDVFLVKTDGEGHELWGRTYGSGDESGYSVEQSTDGGYVVAGRTFNDFRKGYDAYVVRTDASGNEVWSREIGGADYDDARSVYRTTDGGFIVAGTTYSFPAALADVYLIRLNADGHKLWERNFGGEQYDDGRAVHQTADGGFIVTGYTESFGGGESDVYLIKTDANGNELWSKNFGGPRDDRGYSVDETSDGGFVVAGYTYSNDTESFDAYLIKTDADGNELWSNTFGAGPLVEIANAVQETADGGFIVAGATNTVSGFWYDVYAFYYHPDTPTPDLKANGSDWLVVVGENEPLELTISLGVGTHVGEDGDSWILADTPFGIFYYDEASNEWLPGWEPTFQGPFLPFDPVPIFDGPARPAGRYTFYYGVDTVMNGVPDYGDPLFHDELHVEVVSQ